MSRLQQTGWEIALSGGGGLISPDGTAGGGNAAAISTTKKRSGVSSLRCDSGGGSTSFAQINSNGGFPTNTTYYLTVWMLFDALPDSTVSVFDAMSANTQARLTSAGKVQLFVSSVQVGSDSAGTISADGTTWYRFDFRIGRAAGSVNDIALLLNGVQVATTTTGPAAGSLINIGWNANPGASKVMYADDFTQNTGAGGSNNTFPGDSKIILMTPISDNARGAWTAGAGATTSLFDAVNNTPPVGVQESSATNTSQIKNRTTTNPTNCDLNLDTYTNAGVPTGATINAIQLWDADGEDPATGTKAGTISMVSNPAIGPSASFNFGDDAGTQGTFFGNWRWHTVTSDVPSVTLGTAPVIRITCTSGATGSRSASCCFLGAYVDYTAAAAGYQPRFGFANFQDPAIFMRRLWRRWGRRRSGILVPEYA